MNPMTKGAWLLLSAQTGMAVVVELLRYSPQDQYSYMVEMCDRRIVDVAGAYEALECPLDQLNPRQQAAYLRHATRGFLQTIPQAFLSLPGRNTNHDVDTIMEWNAAKMASIISNTVPYDEFWLAPGLYVDPETHARACLLYKQCPDNDAGDRLPGNFLVSGGYYWRVSAEELRERRVSVGQDFYSNLIMTDVTPQRIVAVPPGCLVWSTSEADGASMGAMQIVDYRPQQLTCNAVYFIGCAKCASIDSASPLCVLFTDSDSRDSAVVVSVDSGVVECDSHGNPQYDAGGLLGGYRLLLRLPGRDGAEVEDGLGSIEVGGSHGTSVQGRLHGADAHDGSHGAVEGLHQSRCYLLFQCQLTAGAIRWCGKYPTYDAARNAGLDACKVYAVATSSAADSAVAILAEVPEQAMSTTDSALSKRLLPIPEGSLARERLKLHFPSECLDTGLYDLSD